VRSALSRCFFPQALGELVVRSCRGLELGPSTSDPALRSRRAEPGELADFCERATVELEQSKRDLRLGLEAAQLLVQPPHGAAVRRGIVGRRHQAQRRPWLRAATIALS